MKSAHLLPLLLFTACGGARAVVEVPLSVAPVSSPIVVGDRTYTLTSAALSLDAVRFREPEPVVWTWPSWTSVAYAHPGHSGDAGVVGEWRGPVTVDLLAGGALGTSTVFAGEVATAELVGGTPTLGIEGTVTEGARAVPLSLTVTASEEIHGVVVGWTVRDDAPPEGWALSLDVGAVLGELGDVALPAEGTWRPQDDTVANNLTTFGLLRSTSWTWEDQ